MKELNHPWPPAERKGGDWKLAPQETLWRGCLIHPGENKTIWDKACERKPPIMLEILHTVELAGIEKIHIICLLSFRVEVPRFWGNVGWPGFSTCLGLQWVVAYTTLISHVFMR